MLFVFTCSSFVTQAIPKQLTLNAVCVFSCGFLPWESAGVFPVYNSGREKTPTRELCREFWNSLLCKG